ncbi:MULTISPECIES: S8 family serine peptidase [Streptomyces]|uniref:Serine protease n=1 Tax=Streptomyces fradiae ATCC 10745 = DSM 40063 TaxID=1319510 RepID=A0A1Y2NQB8_STRFR|nr:MULTISPECIES: S8 family serine peptidase [Streptomyces]KAF0648842.1 serine protease [Streptomyces fradiae ATCC 10745 = DSM 40063]OSY49693.1 Thermophilic serine proteinase precursor [Streptomyces fradiae ATCC 10745 = DSM 40063]QEV14364.1 serine protease [Streptomyces fradiae ATCC 10745 = DSM 40063]UQS30404.1 S8 family serine peptidase [Streptomyces fradiae]
MTAGTTRRLRRRVTCAVALVGAWAIGFVGLAPAAAAEDIRAKQWYLDAMHVDKIWQKTRGEGIKVAVIDSGVNPSTPSLKGQVLKGLDATEVDGKTDDYSGHGTTMAELIAGTGKGGGLQGLAPGAKIIPYRIAADDVKRRKNNWDAEDAIRAAADSDAKIINMSFGGIGKTDRMMEAAKYAQSKGKLMFASVGNTGNKENTRQYPGALPEVVGVAGTDPEGRVGKYSTHGDMVDIAAPGSGIPQWCDATFTRYCDVDGTSAATAIASATAALIWSYHPDWTANQVLRVMLESAGKGEGWKPGTTSNYVGHGVVRPGAHINRGLGKPGDPNVDPLTNENSAAPGGGSSATPAAPATPGTSAPASSQAPQDQATPAQAVTGSSGETGGGSSLGLVLGGAAVVVVVAGGAFYFARKRRTA